MTRPISSRRWLCSLVLVACARVSTPPQAASVPEVQAPAVAAAVPRVVLLDASAHHLGDDEMGSWALEGFPGEAEGPELSLDFELEALAESHTLTLSLRGTESRWAVHVNGEVVGQLPARTPDTQVALSIPSSSLRVGRNTLRLVTDDPHDDILVWQMQLHPVAVDAYLDSLGPQGVLNLRVQGEGEAMPARITIVDQGGELVTFHRPGGDVFATRPGLMYTAGSPEALRLPQGKYEVYASRGMEWSIAHASIEVGADSEQSITLDLVREVNTAGWVAADTHIHTISFGNHGDASVEERMLSLAGEGVELAVATDHNHNTDYRPFQAQLGLNPWFTPVTGNEVTTRSGHFNAFPLRAGDTLPNHKLRDWTRLVADIRSHGAQVVILNHPHWPAIHTGPFGLHGLDPASGTRASRIPYTFDAIELVNSNTAEGDPMLLLEDWFGLLNRGEQISGVGSSDSHTLSAPVGQGRTYVPSASEDVSAIDLPAAFQALRGGRHVVSTGIFATIDLRGSSSGDVVVARGRKTLPVEVRVASPSWVQARQVILFVNGQPLQTRVLASADGPRDERVRFELERPDYDAHLVAVVLGDGVDHPAAKTRNPYTLGITNPVWLDVDGGGYQSPRETAKDRLRKAGARLGRVQKLIARSDRVLGPQLLDLVREQLRLEGEPGPDWLQEDAQHREGLHGHAHGP